MAILDQGEVALAIVGISNVINDEMPRWTLERQREFDKYGDSIVKMTDKAIKGMKAPKIKREHDYRETLDRLSEPMPQEEIAKIIRSFPEEKADLAAEFLTFAQNTWQHLKEIFPISEYLTLTGSKNLQPTGDKTWKFFNRLAILNDPMIAIQMIGSGSMLKSEAKVFKEFFPTLSEAITEEIYNSIARASAEKGTETKPFRLSEFAKVGLQNWLDRRSVDFQPTPIDMPRPVDDVSKSFSGPVPALALSRTDEISEAGRLK